MEHLLTKDTEGISLFSKWDGLIPDIFCKYEDGFSTVNRIKSCYSNAVCNYSIGTPYIIESKTLLKSFRMKR